MNTLTGTGTLIRFILRRDRVRIPVWIVAILVTIVGTALVLPETYPNEESKIARAELVENPALKLLLGPGFGLDDYDFGPMLANELLGIMTVVLALMSIFLFVRHTRAEEESGLGGDRRKFRLRNPPPKPYAGESSRLDRLRRADRQ